MKNVKIDLRLYRSPKGTRIFEKNGSYTSSFWHETEYNMLYGSQWGGSKTLEEKESCKIRLTETYDIEWGEESLHKYMKKTVFEDAFKIKLTPEERADIDFLVGFYSYGEYGQIGGIFCVKKLLLSERIFNLMENKKRKDWLMLSIYLLSHDL